MSVLIKGMDMPKQGCYKCLAREGNWCSLLPDVPYREIIACANKEQRHENCPLVGVHNEPWKKWSCAKDTRTLNGVVHCADCKFYDCVTYKHRGLMYCKKYDVTAGLCGDYQICVEYQSNFNDILKRKEEEGWVIPKKEEVERTGKAVHCDRTHNMEMVEVKHEYSN